MYLSFDHISKHFGPEQALQDVTFSVAQGEFVSLLGPSGCGKTTTLMVLAGFEAPTSGTVTLDGQDLAGMPPERREVGVVFQHYALFPHMTVTENIAFGLKHGRRSLSQPAIMDRVAELLEMIDLAPLAQRRPSELSAGQQQRVAIARSLAPQPRVLCFDEPLSALDAILREKLRLDIRRLQRKLNLTVLYVTHDQEEALAISDRVVVMDSGRVLQVGSPWEVYDRPANRIVAEFIGQGSLLAGQVASCGREIGVQLAEDQVVNLPLSAWCGSGPPSADQRVGVVLRAERARVLLPTEFGSGTNQSREDHQLQLPARLDDVEFLGAQLRLHITGGVGAVLATVPAMNVAAWQTRIGQPVIVVCSADDVRLVPWEA